MSPMHARFATLAMMLLLAAGGCEKPKEAPKPQPSPSVEVMTVQARTIPVSYPFVGQTDASRRVQIRARVPGFITARHFQEGGFVKAGDLLYELDKRPFEADLEIAKSKLSEAQTVLANAEVQVSRYTDLVKTGAASRKELDDAVTRRDSVLAQIRAAQATIAKAELTLSYANVTSPVNGLVGATLKDVGAYVDGATNSQLAETIEIDPIYVNFAVAERDILKSQDAIREKRIFLPEGGRLTVELELLDGTTFPSKGQINFTDIALDPGTGTARARAEFPNPAAQLRPGQFVRGHLTGYQRANALCVPRKAILQNPAGASVYILAEGTKVDTRPVTLGAWVDDSVIIEKGLAEGDRVVVEGVQRIAPGMTVELATSKPEAAKPEATKPETAKPASTH